MSYVEFQDSINIDRAKARKTIPSFRGYRGDTCRDETTYRASRRNKILRTPAPNDTIYGQGVWGTDYYYNGHFVPFYRRRKRRNAEKIT